MQSSDAPLRFPHAEPPAFGHPAEIAPGILWLRFPLPFSLDHVNVYLIEDGDGWAVFDTGICDDATQAIWRQVLETAIDGRPITRIIVSHFHPDHAGMAGWLNARFAPPLLMPQTEYLYSRLLQSRSPDSRAEDPIFYRAAGLDAETIRAVLNRGKSYLDRMSGLAPSYVRLLDGETLSIGGRDWQIITGGGHAPEQAMLWCRSDRVFLAADQVLARITPNVSVVEMEPKADPLGLYLASIDRIQAEVDEAVLVLPGHNLPFFGLHRRASQLSQHHHHRCQKIGEACRDASRSAAEIVPILFTRPLDPHQLSFAMGETIAHLNYMVRRGQLERSEDADGVVVRYGAVAG